MDDNNRIGIYCDDSSSLSGLFSNDMPPSSCDVHYIHPPEVFTYTYAFMFGLLSVVTILMYVKISYLAIRNTRCTVGDASSTRRSITSIKMKVSRMLLLVLEIHFVLYIPGSIALQLNSEGDNPFDFKSEVSESIIMVLRYANHAVNPIIYVSNNRHFRMSHEHGTHVVVTSSSDE